MIRRVAVFTGSRADYGLLKGVMREIKIKENLDLLIIAAGSHLSTQLGSTVSEICEDGFHIDACVDTMPSGDGRLEMAQAMGRATARIAAALNDLAPDVLVVLGDRFEALAAAQAATILGIPVSHIHGGEITTGALDDAFRHAITKLASVHFVAAAPYAKRVIQMGATPARVFNVGAPGLDDLLNGNSRPISELKSTLPSDLHEPYFLVTYHAATNANEDPTKTFLTLASVCDRVTEYGVLVTYANADAGGLAINTQIERWAARNSNVVAVQSLGFDRYQTAMFHAKAVVGNSSSGIIEAPAFGVPTLNIGQRQNGRLMAQSVTTVGCEQSEIQSGLEYVLSTDAEKIAMNCENLYGRGNAALKIVETLLNVDFSQSVPFYDIDV